MSIAIINATISGTMTVAGTSTLSGALTSGSTINAQGITSTTLNLTNNLVQTVGNIATGSLGLSCNGNCNITGNTVINSNCSVLGNLALTGSLVAGATTITNASLGFVSGATSNIQTQLNTFTPVSTLLSQTNAWTGLNTYNTNIPTTTISATTANQLTNKTYVDTADTTSATNLRAGTNAWTGTNTYNTILPTTIIAPTTANQLTRKDYVDTLGQQIAGNVTLLQQKTTNQTFSVSTTTFTGSLQTQLTGEIRLNEGPLYFKAVGDNNHSLRYNATSDGPALQGFSGGRLGTTTKGDILTWNTTGAVHRVDVNASLQIASANEVRLNTAPLYLKSTGDNNHFLQYTGAPYDGPALQGNAGGKIGTVTKTDMINWTSSAGINTVNVSANTNLTGNVTILPYTSNTTLSAYQLNCQAITSLGQIVAGGVGIVTAKLQCSNNGTGILGLQVGSFQAATDANQTVTFPNAFLGVNPPIVFLQPRYANAVTGTAYVISTSLTNFTYRFFFDGSVNSESAVLMYWQAYQI